MSTAPTENIIVVDDAPEVLAVVEDMLRDHGVCGYQHRGPARGSSSCAPPPGSIHLLLTDVVISLMSGCQLAQEFRKVRPEAKVLFMSGYNVEAGEAYRLELAPGEPFLKKPFTMDELQRAVTAALVYRPPATWRREHPQR